MPAQPLTKEQLDDAARLKQLFLVWQSRRKDAGLPSSQEAVSELLGFNQSSMSQYLNGKIPLNVSAATKFASVLECSIGDFSPALADDAAAIAAVAAPPGRVDHTQQLIAEWVRTARTDAGLSQGDLGAKLALELGEERGHTKANISHWETQKHSPSLRQLIAIAKITERSLPEQLLPAGAGTTSTEHAANDDNPFLSSARPVRIGEEMDTIPIRRVKLKLRAGIAGYETEPEMEDGGVLNMPRRVIDQLNLVPHQLLAVTVHGCSMEPMLFEDDTVVINTADKKPADRELFAVNFNGEACVKQLWKNGNQWFLRSFHPDHGPINVRSGQCDIVGKVVYQPGRIVTNRL